MLRERDKQIADGKSLEEVMVPKANPVYTFEPQMLPEGMPVMIPVCLNHIAYKESALRAGLITR
jgi:hypothetical protein